MDIAVWLRSLGLGQYEAVFRQNDIDDTVLPNLTAEDLKELGIASLGHRRKLLDAIAALRSDAGGKAPSADVATVSATPRVYPEDRAERRQVTAMFSDLVGSMALSARMDPEDLSGDWAFSPDGTSIVTASDDHTARAWDAKTGVQLTTLSGHTGRVISAAFSPDSTRIATASYDGTARLWDAKTGLPVATLSGHTDWVIAWHSAQTAHALSPHPRTTPRAFGTPKQVSRSRRCWGIQIA